MNSYTEQVTEKIWEFPAVPEMEYDYEEIGSFLNAEFRSFGESITALIEKKIGTKVDNPTTYIKLACKEAGIDDSEIASRNTFKNWFEEGLRPKKSEKSRKSMFALAFALKLTVEETEDLFHKAYLDRSFNHRDYKELIYYYCISRGLSFTHANQLINMVNIENSTPSDTTIYTTAIKSDIQTITEDSALLAYIENHKHNLSMNNKRALELLELYKEKSYPFVERNSSMHGNSAKMLFEAITGHRVGGKTGTTTIKFANNTVPAEIKNNFPQVKNLTETAQSYEELRKVLILVASYWFWSELKANQEESYDDFEEYSRTINLILLEANMPPLYLGNPYDWMFAYCASTESPLESFWGIMDEVLI